MATHADAQVNSGNGHDTFEGQGSDLRDESQFDEKVAEFGLEPTKAYVRVARRKKKLSQAAIDKRKYRAERLAQGFGQYVVEVPVDKDARHAVYAVAQAIVDDKENNKNIRSIISTVASSPALLDLCQRFSASGFDVSSIVDLIERGDLTKVAAIRAEYPTLLEDIVRLAQAIVDDENNTKNIRMIISTVVSNPTLPELCQLLSASGVDVSSIVELIERGDLTKIVAIREASSTLLEDIVRLVESNDEFMSVLDCLVRHEAGISDGSAKGLLGAAVAANDCPEVLRFLEVRRRGGLRGRVLGWVLGGSQ